MSWRFAGNEPESWEARLRAAAEQSSHRRRVREAERRDHARRRAHGMIDRNAARLAEVRRRARRG